MRISDWSSDVCSSDLGLVMDIATHKVTRNGRDVHLGPTEFRLLRYFLEHPGRVLSRDQLLDAVWGRDIYVEQRTVGVQIRRLGQALDGVGGNGKSGKASRRERVGQ